MHQLNYQYLFSSEIDIDEVECTIVVSVIALQSLHGATQVRLDLTHYLDREIRQMRVDASTAIGRDFNCIFAGLLLQEFGEAAFRVERIATPLSESPRSPSSLRWGEVCRG